MFHRCVNVGDESGPGDLCSLTSRLESNILLWPLMLNLHSSGVFRFPQTDLQTLCFQRGGAEMAVCVRSGDCAEGLCCVRYLTGKRCQRIPLEGDACLLRAPTKLKRTLGRCACAAGLTCSTHCSLQKIKANHY
uniref:Dickkopf-related protein 1/2/4 C-terminal subdomain 1 domain-containing protein n=1 Tax=Oryzias sinensis TaxID=183150 RepID=A0A8C7YEV7_9TELE